MINGGTFKTQHEASVYIAKSKSEGKLKNCYNLKIGVVSFLEHHIICSENSLIKLSQGYSRDYQCPTDCHFFITPRRQKFKGIIQSFPDKLKSPFRWFASLPWQTQCVVIVTIVVLVILFLAPNYKDSLLEIIREIRETIK